MVSSYRTRGNGHKLKHRKFHMNMTVAHFEGDEVQEQAVRRVTNVAGNKLKTFI